MLCEVGKTCTWQDLTTSKVHSVYVTEWTKAFADFGQFCAIVLSIGLCVGIVVLIPKIIDWYDRSKRIEAELLRLTRQTKKRR